MQTLDILIAKNKAWTALEAARYAVRNAAMDIDSAGFANVALKVYEALCALDYAKRALTEEAPLQEAGVPHIATTGSRDD